MTYIARNGHRNGMGAVRNGRNGHSLHGFGADDVSSTTFNADGWLFPTSTPAATPPAVPEPSIWDKIGAGLKIALNPTPVVSPPLVPAQTGMSTTTMIALAGGAILVVALLARR